LAAVEAAHGDYHQAAAVLEVAVVTHSLVEPQLLVKEALVVTVLILAADTTTIIQAAVAAVLVLRVQIYLGNLRKEMAG
jgi:hypothetical protein